MFSLHTLENLWLNLPTTYQSVHPSIVAEVKMVLILIHRNTILNLSDHMTQHVKVEVKGIKAVERFSFNKTKAVTIINWTGYYLYQGGRKFCLSQK